MKNNAGQLAGPKESFGPFHRYAVAPVHSRFGGVHWFVWDAEQEDEVTGGPKVIRIEDSKKKALDGMDTMGYGIKWDENEPIKYDAH